MAAYAGRVVDADLERVRSLGNSGATVVADRRAHVEAGTVRPADRTSEDRAPLGGERREAELEPRGGRVGEPTAARRIRRGDVAANAPDVRNVESERRARKPLPRRVVVVILEPDLEPGAAGGANG